VTAFLLSESFFFMTCTGEKREKGKGKYLLALGCAMVRCLRSARISTREPAYRTAKDACELFLLTTYYHIHLVIAKLGNCFLVERELLFHDLYWGKERKGKREIFTRLGLCNGLMHAKCTYQHT
jgi:hypothetical protein